MEHANLFLVVRFLVDARYTQVFFQRKITFVSQILKVHSANRHEKNHQFFSLAPARAATVTSRTVLREQKDHMFCASDPKVFWRCGLKFWIHLVFQKIKTVLGLRCGCGLQKRTIINPQNTVPWCFEVWSHMENFATNQCEIMVMLNMI